MTIDPASFEPVYRQLARILRDQIRSGELRAGAMVGSEASLSQRFGVGRDAVRDALAALRSEGLVITERGMGTFVRGPAEHVEVLHVGAGTRVSARVPTEDERRVLGIPEGTAVLVVTRAGEPDRLLPARTSWRAQTRSTTLRTSAIARTTARFPFPWSLASQ